MSQAENKSTTLGREHYREYIRGWKKRNPDKVKAYAELDRERHPERFAATSKRYWDRHIDRLRKISAERARNRYAVPELRKVRTEREKAKREKRYLAEAGRPRPSICDLCRRNNGGIVFDHCHQYGHFRGWICDRCNKILGLVGDSASLLKKMARYLESSDGKVNGKSEEGTPLERFCRSWEVFPGGK